MEIKIHYQDQDIIVVEKPSMLLSVPGRGKEKYDSVATRLQQLFPEIGVVHRLDWETSGLMVFAIHKESLRHLNKQFMYRQVKKEYQARVYGILEGKGEIDVPMRCDWENRPRQIIDREQGKNAYTQWQNMSTQFHMGEAISHLKLIPKTGRSHQLRVHMLHLKHPILGDPLYADQKALKMADRMQLHATSLEFFHPQDNREMKFKSICPF